MRAALLETSNSPLALVDDLDVAEPGPGLVRVHGHHCGLCHSDLGSSFLSASGTATSSCLGSSTPEPSR